MLTSPHIFFFFFFNDTATTEIYTLSLHDALPISRLYARSRDDDGRSAGLDRGAGPQGRRLRLPDQAAEPGGAATADAPAHRAALPQAGGGIAPGQARARARRAGARRDVTPDAGGETDDRVGG